jgi:hypothetical protein
MKAPILLLTILSFNPEATLKSNMPSTYLETGIPNSHLVTENVIRGMAPNQNDLQTLIDLGVEKYLMFKNDTDGSIAKEIAVLKKLGIPEKIYFISLFLGKILQTFNQFAR